MYSPQNLPSRNATCCTKESEELAHQAKTGDENQAHLLLLFEPLLCNCAKRAALMLPYEDRAILVAETRYAFLLLLGQFDAEQGVPFVGYIKTKLCFYMFNWCRLEQKRLRGATSFDEDAFETSVCAAWLTQNARIAGGGRRVVARGSGAIAGTSKAGYAVGRARLERTGNWSAFGSKRCQSASIKGPGEKVIAKKI